MIRPARTARHDPVEDQGALELVVCPECGATAEVEWRSADVETRGQAALVKVRCLNRHWFLMPLDV